MKKFKVEIQEFLARVVEIEEATIEDAISKVSDKYKKAEIVLDYNDFAEVEFIDIEATDANHEKQTLIKELIDYLYEDEKKHYETYKTSPQNHIYVKLKRLSEIM